MTPFDTILLVLSVKFLNYIDGTQNHIFYKGFKNVITFCFEVLCDKYAKMTSKYISHYI